MTSADRINNLKLAVQALENAKAYALAAIGEYTDVGDEVATRIEELQADLESDIRDLE